MNILIAVLAALFIAFLLLPLIIKVSVSIDLMDNPDLRKNHSVSTPALGGIAIFVGFLFALLLTVNLVELGSIKYFLFGLIIIFVMGLRDDISGLLAKHKLFAQVFAAFLIAQFSELKLTGFYGLAGFNEMPEWFNLLFTIFVVVGLTNSFNLIDGIDGLAGSISALILSFYGIVFYLSGEMVYAAACGSLVGSLVAFLFFNWQPAKIFMGDTGSMILGFSIAAFTIHLLNTVGNKTLYGFEVGAPVALALFVLIVPIVDTLRVFIIRFWNGNNPLDPDRNHLHHEIKRLGLNDRQTTFLLLAINLCFIVLAILLNGVISNMPLIIGGLVLISVLLFFLEFRLSRIPENLKDQNESPEKHLYISKSA
ncbi:MAG: undecaprenyl/decaprenyl-phosphate alpha-N-acetylglucosaminyl 1-phosphate transferase [Cyclobacteriaceae bacterium]